MIAACGRVARASVNAASSRIGPSRLVVTVRSATDRKSAVWTSSGSMIPAMVTSTFSSGNRVRTSVAAVVIESGSVVSMTTVSIPGWSAAICSSSSVRRPPTITWLPAA